MDGAMWGEIAEFAGFHSLAMGAAPFWLRSPAVNTSSGKGGRRLSPRVQTFSGSDGSPRPSDSFRGSQSFHLRQYDAFDDAVTASICGSEPILWARPGWNRRMDVGLRAS